jgi:hypothetical protein
MLDLEYHHLIMIKLWNPQTWILNAPVELFIDKKASLRDFSLLL